MSHGPEEQTEAVRQRCQAFKKPYVEVMDLLRERHQGPQTYDGVLIDGRFHLACLIQALKHTSPLQSTVMLHDIGRYISFIKNDLKDAYEVVEVVGNMGMLRKRAGVDVRRYRGAYERVVLDAR
ncbi:unnamed protein product [Vitrella brassicaformis CCMP3155]|uniref:Uncharacterized protein n=2 Tax=Vitrella brassicaformis TaxID=1169539 RepID=A0A0G4H783_VITBC|nr:unnamed protein product [Vitrella brassicaformis CCMP3155]|mmetsp:Transcript_1973/g.4333  ORF Transcript_1973/g.4333 Transcript_1973/m.4333 type:complete len:124 (+) Transcript_1973:269-640(+)|eukprot:CEM39590.1 unnamed protein product [Vitrella brassicaformis CCMP3155]